MKSDFYYLPKKILKMAIFLYIIFNSNLLCAQEIVSKGLDSVEDIFNVKYEMPKGFNNLNNAQLWRSDDSFPRGIICWIFESKDKQCKVLYNVFPLFQPYTECTCNSHRDIMYREVKSVLEKDDFVLDNYIRVLPQEEARRRFNADSIFIYDVSKAIFGMNDVQFPHCTRMIITREERPILDLVWYFTDKGKKREEKYMQKINKHIWYNNSDWKWDWQRWEEWMKTYFEEIMENRTLSLQME